MSNISKNETININDNKPYLKRLKKARNEIKDTIILQDINQDDLFATQSNSDKTKFYIENIHLDPEDQLNGMLDCGCPDQRYRGVECKHISKIKMKLLAKTDFKKFDLRSEISNQAATDFIVLENLNV